MGQNEILCRFVVLKVLNPEAVVIEETHRAYPGYLTERASIGEPGVLTCVLARG